MECLPGALYSSEDKAIIAGNVNFSWNGAESSGGAIAVFRPLNLSVSGAAFVSNRVENSFGSSSFFVEPTGGGAIWLDSGGNEEAGCVPSWNQECDGPLLANLTFDNNSAASNGRAVFVSTPFDSVFIQGTTFHKNFAGTDGVGDGLHTTHPPRHSVIFAGKAIQDSRGLVLTHNLDRVRSVCGEPQIPLLGTAREICSVKSHGLARREGIWKWRKTCPIEALRIAQPREGSDNGQGSCRIRFPS